MAFDSRFTSYQIPYQPLFETTKQQIERSLFSLEEKLRRRKQIDLQMQIQREADIMKAIPVQSPYEAALRDYEEKERTYQTIAKEQLKIQQIAKDSQHYARLEQLRFQRDQLARQAQFSIHPPVSYEPPLIHAPSPSDQQLIKKYEDGSKAKEYYYDLSNQIKKQEQAEIAKIKAQLEKEAYEKQKLKVEKERQQFQTDRQQFQTDRKFSSYETGRKQYSKQGEYTPYDFIKHPKVETHNKKQNKKAQKKQELVKELERQFDQLQPRHAQSAFKLPSYNKSSYPSTSPVKMIKTPNEETNQLSPYQQRMNRYKSMGKMPCNRSKSNLSPHQVSILDSSYLQAKEFKGEVKPSMKELELDAIKKIQNRLKVSKVIYEDSKFKNKKYEGNHLFNTFEIELRFRKEVKDKINSHPLVLRKHPLVVE